MSKPNKLQPTDPRCLPYRSASSCSDTTTANSCYGGYARLMTAVNTIRNQSQHPVFLLDAGDEFMGTLWDTTYKGQATARAQNLLQPDVMTIGNHEVSRLPGCL